MKTSQRQNAEWISLSQAASLLDCSKKTIRRRIKSGGWETYLDKLSDGRSVRKVRKADVLAYIESNLPAELRDRLSGDRDCPGTDRPSPPVQNVRRAGEEFATALEDARAQEAGPKRAWFEAGLFFGVGIVTGTGLVGSIFYALIYYYIVM